MYKITKKEPIKKDFTYKYSNSRFLIDHKHIWGDIGEEISLYYYNANIDDVEEIKTIEHFEPIYVIKGKGIPKEEINNSHYHYNKLLDTLIYDEMGKFSIHNSILYIYPQHILYLKLKYGELFNEVEVEEIT